MGEGASVRGEGKSNNEEVVSKVMWEDRKCLYKCAQDSQSLDYGTSVVRW